MGFDRERLALGPVEDRHFHGGADQLDARHGDAIAEENAAHVTEPTVLVTEDRVSGVEGPGAARVRGEHGSPVEDAVAVEVTGRPRDEGRADPGRLIDEPAALVEVHLLVGDVGQAVLDVGERRPEELELAGSHDHTHEHGHDHAHEQRERSQRPVWLHGRNRTD